MFEQIYTVRRLNLWKFLWENTEEIPKESGTLETLIKTFFFRYFGLEQNLITAEEFDLVSFNKQVASFRALIRRWKTVCKGYSLDFEKKPFFQEFLVLQKKQTHDIPTVEGIPDVDLAVEDIHDMEDITDGDADHVQEATPFKQLAESTKRKKSAELRKNFDPDLILKAAHQTLRESNHDAGVVFEKLQKNPQELGKNLC